MSHVNRLDRRKWTAARLAALEASSWRCRQCGRPGRLEVDHIQPLSEGGAPFDQDNLQVLCRPCHWTKTLIERGVDPERLAWRRLRHEIDFRRITP